jgi:DivIVA domain-containing protein
LVAEIEPPEPSMGPADAEQAVPADIREPSFAVAVRGYDRRSVDRYVERANRLIAELQLRSSSRAAVRHALERVGEQTSSILYHARETAEEITTAAREEAEELVARARAEAAEVAQQARGDASGIVADAQGQADEILRKAQDESERVLAQARVESERKLRVVEEEIDERQEQAETRVRALQADIAAIAERRRTELDEMRRIAARLEEVVAEGEPAAEEPSPEPEAEAESAED